MAALLALLALNLGGIAEAGVLSFIVLFFLAVSALAAGHFLGGSALGIVHSGNGRRPTSDGDSNAHSGDKLPKPSNHRCDCDLSHY